MESEGEKALQEGFEWARSRNYAEYNRVVGYYQAKVCLEHARGDSLLDMPCGDGTLTAMMAPHFRRIVGVDASGKHLQIARRLLPNVEFVESLIEEYDSLERFGTIAMINVLEHVEDPVIALRKAAEHLDNEGVMVVHVPNAYAINRRLAVLMGTLTHCEELSPFDLNVAGHRRAYSLKTLRDDVERAGLRIQHTGGVFYKSLSTPQMDWFLNNGLWEEGGFGWGRVGATSKDWRAEFCRASYELGIQHPEDCNIVYACVTQ